MIVTIYGDFIYKGTGSFSLVQYMEEVNENVIMLVCN